MSSARLREILVPRRGEHVLEVGVGSGAYALDVAADIAPGRLDVVDMAPEMLEATMRRARERQVVNIHPTLADVRYLPYGDATFDAAYTVAALGIAGPDPALGELARVMRPTGRLVVGELFGDPHLLRADELKHCAARAGLRLASRRDFACGYFALLEPAAGPRPRFFSRDAPLPRAAAPR